MSPGDNDNFTCFFSKVESFSSYVSGGTLSTVEIEVAKFWCYFLSHEKKNHIIFHQ